VVSTGLDFRIFFLRHQEERVVAHAVDIPLVKRVHIHGIFAHLNLGERGIFLRHHQRVGRTGHDGQQRHRQNDLLAIADDPPIIEEV